MCIYIYIERERDRERDTHIYTYTYIYTYIFVYTVLCYTCYIISFKARCHYYIKLFIILYHSYGQPS